VSYVPAPAGFWKRYVAYFVDVLLLSVVNQVLMTVVWLAAMSSGAAGLDLDTWRRALTEPPLTVDAALALMMPLVWLTLVSLGLYVLVAAAYFIGMEGSRRQATFGKQLIGIRVTGVDGQPPGYGRAAGRFAAATLSWLTLNLGHALAAWTREHRALHDFLAGTRVELVDPTNTKMPAWAWLVIALNVLIFVATGVVLVVTVALFALQPGLIGEY
jgi:uncharacterized RDD family membrane protein YckC